MPLISYIPDEYENGFKIIAEMEDSVFRTIIDGLNSVELTSSIENLAILVGNSKNLHHLNLEEIFSSVGALLFFIEDKNDIEKISHDVATIFSSKETEYGQLNKLEERVLILLNDKKIYYAYKAKKLITENPNNFISCRIVSDLRPVFDLDLEQPPIAGVVTHTLHIHYDSDVAAPHKDFYITLDSYDIQTLIDALTRAEKKEETLSSIFSKSGMKNLNE